MAYIERETAIDKILSLKTSGAFTEAFKNAVLQALEQEPAADVVEVRHGKWEKLKDGYWCSNCCILEKDLKQEYNYCPNCGAKMDGKDGE